MNKRYHIHFCCATEDLVPERALMMQKLADRCFFTWSFKDANAIATNYSRNQIENCDYVLFIIGNLYGSLAASGVSYVHLDCIYALAKRKQSSIMAMVLVEDEVESKEPIVSDNIFNQRKLRDFKSYIKNTCTNWYQFNSLVDFPNKMNIGFDKLFEQNPADGWVRNTKVTKPSSITQYEIPILETPGEVSNAEIAKTELTDKFHFTYRVQAFKDGNFKELSVQYEITWGEILSIIADDIRMPANEDIVPRVLHEYIEKIALSHVQQVIPTAHAAARININIKDIQQIKLQLTVNDWLATADYTTAGKRLLILTPQGARQVTQWRSRVQRLKRL